MAKLIRYTAFAAALGAPLALLEHGSMTTGVDAKKKSKKSGESKKATGYKDGKSKNDGIDKGGIRPEERERPDKSRETHKDRKKAA